MPHICNVMKSKITVTPGTKLELRLLGTKLREARLRRELP